jgi:hypothetical protein
MTYAVSVRGDRRPPPIQPRPTQPSTLRSSVTPSVTLVCRYHDGRGRDDTIVLVVARVEGIGLVLQPDSGGGPLCMPLCYWATQTAVAPIDRCVGLGRLALTPYLPPHQAATVIQRAYLSHCLRFDVQVWRREMALAMSEFMLELQANRFVTPYGSVSSSSLCRLDNG